MSQGRLLGREEKSVVVGQIRRCLSVASVTRGVCWTGCSRWGGGSGRQTGVERRGSMRKSV